MKELSDEALEKVSGGDWASNPFETPFCIGYCNNGSRKITPGDIIPYFKVSTKEYCRCINHYNNNDKTTTYVFQSEKNPDSITLFVASAKCNVTADFI